MTNKKLKEIAQEIANAEKILLSSQDKKEIKSATKKIYELAGQIKNFEDMVKVDDMVQNILK